jgi:hypothetical protein
MTGTDLSVWAPLGEEPTLWSTVDPKRTLQVIETASRLEEAIGETIKLQDIVVHLVELADPKTGELASQRRTILLCSDGKAYATVSKVIYNSLRRIVQAMGSPDQWPEDGLPVKIGTQRAKTGRMFTMSPV